MLDHHPVGMTQIWNQWLTDEVMNIPEINRERVVSLATEDNITGNAEGMLVEAFFVSPINFRATDNSEKTCNKSKKTLDKVFGQKSCFQRLFAPPPVSGCLSIREATGDPFATLC